MRSLCDQLESTGFYILSVFELSGIIEVSFRDVEFTVRSSDTLEDALGKYGAACYNKGFTEGTNDVKLALKALVTISD